MIQHVTMKRIALAVVILLGCSGSQIRHYPAISGTWTAILEWTTQDPKFIQASRLDPEAIQKARFFARAMSLTFFEDRYDATVDLTALSEQEREDAQVPNRVVTDTVKIVESSSENGLWTFKIRSNKTGLVESRLVRLVASDHLTLEAPAAQVNDFPMHFKRKSR